MGAAAQPSTERALAQAAHDFRAVGVAIGDAAAVFRANLQQTWTLDDLCRRYSGHTREQILGLLALHAAYTPARGRHVVVHLDHVLAIDDALRRELTR